MKKIISEFFKRGFIACGFGPLVLAVVYLIVKGQTGVETISVNEVCTGIFSLSALAFIAGGLNVLYLIEKLPLMAAILIHGVVLYVTYFATYIINGWLLLSKTPILLFTLIFVVGYIIIWAIIYGVTKNKTKKLNQMINN